MGITEKAASAVAAAPVIAAPVAKAATSLWNFKDGTAYANGVDQYYKFRTSDFTHITPVSGDMTTSMKETMTYLKSHPDRSLEITGYYTKDEENKSILPNLGLARAGNISKYMTSLGVASNQITTKGVLVPASGIVNGILAKGAEFTFTGKVAADGRLKTIKDRLFGKPVTLYFGTNQDNINLTAQQRTDFADLKYYLDNVSTSNLEVSGHTDAVGNRDYNVNLSQERAKFVSDYLSKFGGINTSRTRVLGSGPDKPVGDNATSAGRAKNRRVEVTLR